MHQTMNHYRIKQECHELQITLSKWLTDDNHKCWKRTHVTWRDYALSGIFCSHLEGLRNTITNGSHNSTLQPQFKLIPPKCNSNTLPCTSPLNQDPLSHENSNFYSKKKHNILNTQKSYKYTNLFPQVSSASYSCLHWGWLISQDFLLIQAVPSRSSL